MGSSSCHLEAQDKDGGVVADRKFGTSEANLIGAFGALKGEVWVHLETGELTAWIHRVLKDRVARVVVGHAKSSAWIAKDPLKRDRLDAHKLATLLRMGQVHEVYYAKEEHRTEFKHLVQHYDDVTRQEAKLKTKIKARFRAQGVIPTGTGVYGRQGRTAYLARVSSEVARETIEQLYGLLDQTLEAQKKAGKLLRREAKKYPEIARFDEIPGVGLVTACRVSAYVQTPHRFSSKRKLWRYCRLGITDRTSDGKPLGRQQLDWNGNGRLKEASRNVFNGAMKTREDNQFKRAFRETLQRTHDGTHARLSTRRKILAVMLAMWKGGTRYQDKKG